MENREKVNWDVIDENNERAEDAAARKALIDENNEARERKLLAMRALLAEKIAERFSPTRRRRT